MISAVFRLQVRLQGIGLFKTDAHDVACLQDKLNNDHILNGGPLHRHDLLDQVCAVDHRSFLQYSCGVRKGCGVHDGCPAGTLPDAADDVDGAERFRQRHEVDAGVKQAVHRSNIKTKMGLGILIHLRRCGIKINIAEKKNVQKRSAIWGFTLKDA